MKKFALVFFLGLIFSTSLIGQEVCNNGLDDDGDGDIDINDTDCICGPVMPLTFIGDFENISCCPFNFTSPPASEGIFCLNDDWTSASDATPDLFHLCDYVGGVVLPEAPMPFPSGDGVAGFISGPGYVENVGACLNVSMIPGEDYDISFYVGFNSNSGWNSQLNFEITLYGTDSCVDFPVNGFVCMSLLDDWYEIETFTVNAFMTNTWEFISTSFTANESTQAVALGASCAFANSFPNEYHYLDDVEISGNFQEPPETIQLELSGDCIDGYYIEALDDSAIDYQWYLDGEYIDGATSNPYLIPNDAEGEYQAFLDYGSECAVTASLDVNINLNVLEIPGDPTSIDCPQDANGSIEIFPDSPNSPFDIMWSNGETSSFIDNLIPGIYTVTVTDANGCFGIENFEVESPDLLELSVDVVQPTGTGGLGTAELFIDGGTPDYDISWNNGNTTLIDNNLPAGIYNIIVVDANGCEATIEFEIFDPLVVIAEYESESCLDDCNGFISLTISGGAPGYDIDWNVAGSSSMIEDLCGGPYSYMVEDQNGTVVWGDIDLDPGTDMELELDYQAILCDENGSTTIDLTVIGGTEPYEYIWQDGTSTEDYGIAPVGFYAVTVNDDSGCTIETDFFIDFSFPIEIDDVTEPAPCGTDGEGSIDITIGGGTSPYFYNWSNGADTEDIFNLFSGTYTLTVSDVNGCESIQSFQVESNSDLVVVESVVGVVCPNDSNGAISLNVTGGTTPYSIIWDNGSTEPMLDNLTVGAYDVTITDAMDCIWINSFSLDSESQLDVIETIDEVACFGDQTGSIQLEISSTSDDLSFVWDNGFTEQNLINVNAGIYFLTITDDLGCLYEYDYLVLENPAFGVADSLLQLDCFGDTDAEIYIQTNENEVFTYQWDNGSSLPDLIGLSEGVYTVTITDSNLCEQIYEYVIVNPQEIELVADIVAAGCEGESIGEINVTPTGGLEPYEILWSTGETSNVISDLASGSYQVTIEDANGCIVFDEYLIEENAEFIVQEVLIHVSCFGFMDGMITLDVANGTPPYEFDWSNNLTGSSISDLPSGIYSVDIVDAELCMQTLTFEIEEPSELILSSMVIDARCFGETGMISVFVEGGSGSYDYNWSSGEITTDITNGAGFYTIDVEDSNGCVISQEFEIAEPQPLSVEVSNLVYPSQSGDDGSVDLDINGGTSPYQVTWDNGLQGESISDLTFGVYIAEVTDMNGCTESIEVSMIPGELMYDSVVEPSTCFNACDGSLQVVIEGGQEPIVINWSNGETGFANNELCSGLYSATITDALGNEIETDFFEILEPEEIIITEFVTGVSCINLFDASIGVSITGGVEPYILNWSTGDDTDLIVDLPPGEYEVEVIDGNNCIQSEIYIIEDIELWDVTLEVSDPGCDSELGQIVIQAEDIFAYSILIDGEIVDVSSIGLIEQVSSGTYQVSYQVNEDCFEDIDVVTINPRNEINIQLSESVIDVKFEETFDLFLQLSSEQIINNYSIEWISVNPIVCTQEDLFEQCISVNIIAQESETLKVVFTDDKGCIIETEVRINVVLPPVISVPNIFSPNSDGENDGWIVAPSRRVESVENVIIYDRWGSLVYQERYPDINEIRGWDGKKNGKEAIEGVYIYLIELTLQDGQTELFTGDLTLIR